MFVSPGTKLAAYDEKARNRLFALNATPSAELESSPWLPFSPRLARIVRPVARFLTKTSVISFVSPETRFDASEVKAR
jgi:hypothetical protein